ncbi:glycosyl hydrolase [Aspergillus costaricaensis CBS 115574]|uniref:Glycosyl hydrolase n=1 Tax=Aspergillus costaricaensis CBS 115574 TaxID=1448317 RepID=A0ACD1IMC6_9EURO|nr:glycosyl hydrolase [Aspergillus costaricaensis CBS 115574]RAK91556.1 glycosyl hydrolase [Aspergillus costaricaensis CBS 115574]
MNLLLLLSSLLLTTTTTATTLIPDPGNRITIPTWHIQPTNTTYPPNTLNLNLTTPDSHSTILATLLHPQNQPNPIIPPYNESGLFHSTTLSTIPTTPFQSPWLYTTTLTLPNSQSHLNKNTTIILSTHGISSHGDIFINGAQIGSISGAYNGQEYDISPQLREGVENEVQVKVYPVDYTRDFGIGWADWNPSPPDKGMGVWRGVEVRGVYGVAGGCWGDRRSSGVQFAEAVTLRGGEVTTVEAEVTIKNPKIWWPATWGKQDMYTVSANFTLSDGTLSDTAECSFGIRSVTATFTEHGDEKDASFRVNGYPFHVRGAGYSPDIFLRFDIDRVRTLLQAVLDMGLNTIRLEGKLEHPLFYDLADRMGIMVLAGWECCDKWEAWEYNTDLQPSHPWTNHDYLTATSMLTHTSLLLQPHPSILAFLLGSDYPPNPRAFTLYTTALNHSDWTAPIISSASARIHPSGMKMLGPYDWVPPNYWYGERLGAAYGFGSEQGAGVGTPELPSLRRFLSEEELDRLWKDKNAAMYHMSPAGSQFHTRGAYNAALWGRFGKPTSLEEYVFLAQVVDYEATRAEFEAFAVRQNRSGADTTTTGGNGGGRAATGVVYWMLNSAWPSLHWQLVDYYLKRGGAYYGVKVGARGVHVAVDYESGEVYVVNHGVKRGEGRVVVVDVVGLDGKKLYHEEVEGVVMGPTMSKKVTSVVPWVGGWDGVVFLRLLLKESGGNVLSRNVYTLPGQLDVLDWDESTWYTTPVSEYADFSVLRKLPMVEVGVSGKMGGGGGVSVTLENQDKAPAWFVRISMVDEAGGEVDVWWEDNYVSVLGGEKVVVSGSVDNSRKMGIGRMRVVVEGGNVRKTGCYIS